MDDKKEENKETLKETNKEIKYIIVLSSYGYLKISEEELNNNLLTIYKFIQYKTTINNNENLLEGFIYKDNIKQTIDVKVKCFQNKRNLTSFDKININSKINILIENLFSKEDQNNLPKKFTKNTQHRLYSCSKGLRELNTGYTFYENDIKDKETLVYLPEPLLFF